MLNTELLSDIKKHRDDIIAHCTGIKRDDRNKMLDRMSRDLCYDSSNPDESLKNADRMASTHGVKHTNAISAQLLLDALNTPA